jgi:4-amino-4-deoxychorismate lyase
LTASAASIGLPAVERRRIQVLVGLVLPKAASGDASLRLVWTAGPARGAPSALALLSDIPDWIEPARERGASAVSLLGVRASAPWLLPGVKSTSYAVNMAAEAEARRRGVDEALFVDADGIVLEGTVTNVWWRIGDTLFTPALDLGILAGVTRATLMELAPECGFSVEEGAYPLARLLESEEAFTSSSVREVMPLVEVDGRTLGRGPAADALQTALLDLAAKV